MKKAQIISQVFIYILAIFLIAFVLGYGYKAIDSFRQKTEQISYIKFKTDLENAVKAVRTDFGTVSIKEFQVPSGYKEICFVENYFDLDPNFASSFEADYPLIVDSVSSGIEKNVFLVKDVSMESFYVGKIDVSPDLYCLPAGSAIKLSIEGRGDHVVISSAT